jgi:hypothetical protein
MTKSQIAQIVPPTCDVWIGCCSSTSKRELMVGVTTVCCMCARRTCCFQPSPNLISRVSGTHVPVFFNVLTRIVRHVLRTFCVFLWFFVAEKQATQLEFCQPRKTRRDTKIAGHLCMLYRPGRDRYFQTATSTMHCIQLS